MSVICGIVRFDGKIVNKEEIKNMLNTMKNHSNDSEGIWIDGNVGFAHKMLWTTPESLHENQPLVSNDGDLVLTADARIDNRDELFEKLEINENDFKIVTDGDLILWSYKKWGEECPKYLLGDFAFAIWDKHQQKLFCSRDRFGIRPIYFYFLNEIVYFSSNIDLLYTLIDEPISVNDNAINSFARFTTIGYEETMYQNIFRIPPAYFFIFSKEGLNKYRYWFPEKIKIDYHIPFEEAKQEVYRLLSKAVEARLRVYGDWGCEVSGGLDSTAISLIAQKATHTQFKTFSMRYQSYTCDEWEYTKEAITTLGSMPIILDIDQLDVKNEYNLHDTVELNKHWPLYGSFIHNYVLGNMMVKNGIRICLTGHGGDHVFTGDYNPILNYIKNFRFISALNEFFISDKQLSVLVVEIIKLLVPQKIKFFVKKYLLNKDVHLNNQSAENFTDYWNLSFNDSIKIRGALSYISGNSQVTHIDNNYYRTLELYENIEFRHPFFDTNLIEYILTLPNYYFYKGGTTKIILREALKELYPSLIYERKDKAEFSEALLDQMNAIDMDQVWKDSLLIKNELLDKSHLYELIEQYKNKTINASDLGDFWKMTTLELWLKNKNQEKTS